MSLEQYVKNAVNTYKNRYNLDEQTAKRIAENRYKAVEQYKRKVQDWEERYWELNKQNEDIRREQTKIVNKCIANLTNSLEAVIADDIKAILDIESTDSQRTFLAGRVNAYKYIKDSISNGTISNVSSIIKGNTF